MPWCLIIDKHYVWLNDQALQKPNYIADYVMVSLCVYCNLYAWSSVKNNWFDNICYSGHFQEILFLSTSIYFNLTSRKSLLSKDSISFPIKIYSISFQAFMSQRFGNASSEISSNVLEHSLRVLKSRNWYVCSVRVMETNISALTLARDTERFECGWSYLGRADVTFAFSSPLAKAMQVLQSYIYKSVRTEIFKIICCHKYWQSCHYAYALFGFKYKKVQLTSMIILNFTKFVATSDFKNGPVWMNRFEKFRSFDVKWW